MPFSRELAAKKRLEERRNEENQKNVLEAKRKKSDEKVKEWMDKKKPKCDIEKYEKNGCNTTERTKLIKFQRTKKNGAKYDEWLSKKKQQERGKLWKS